jgi:sulfatase modifying factor 1
MKQTVFALLFILVFSHCLPAKESNSSRFDSEDVNSGWKKSPWLGYFYAPLGDWIFHNKLQWLFVGEDTNDSTWVFSERIGWLWTSSGNFPHMWVNSTNEWIYFDSHPEKVFSYLSNTWHDFEDYSDLKEKNNSLEIQRQEEQEAVRLAEIQRQILELYTLSAIQGQHRNIVWDAAGNTATANRTVTVGNRSVDLNATVAMDMLWVPPGTFSMGQSDISSAAPVHDVTLSKGFYLGKYEVTQAQYQAVMTGNTDSLSATPSTRYNGNANRPVETVSWDDIQIFLSRLNAQQSANIPAGWSYVLPTEAEWEYACRAGTSTVYSWGDDINATHANCGSSGLSHTSDAGNYAANPWGFFDMHGNVWEWTADRYGTYSSGAQTDPTGPASGSSRVFRGGSWYFSGTHLSSAYRTNNLPSLRDYLIGFRVGFKQQ